MLLSRLMNIHTLKPYTGMSDPRSALTFVDEFENLTGYLSDDCVKGQVFYSKLDITQFLKGRSYNNMEGFQTLKAKFLNTEWNEIAREQMIHQIDSIQYDPSKYKGVGNFILSIYAKLYDCQLPSSIIYSKIMRVLIRVANGFYAAKITKEHVKDYDKFTALITELDAAYSHHLHQDLSNQSQKQVWVRQFVPKEKVPAALMIKNGPSESNQVSSETDEEFQQDLQYYDMLVDEEEFLQGNE